MRFALASLLLAVIAGGIILLMSSHTTSAMENGADLMSEKPEGYPVATLAGGCFWCTESEYRALPGVLYTRVGTLAGISIIRPMTIPMAASPAMPRRSR